MRWRILQLIFLWLGLPWFANAQNNRKSPVAVFGIFALQAGHCSSRPVRTQSKVQLKKSWLKQDSSSGIVSTVNKQFKNWLPCQRGHTLDMRICWSYLDLARAKINQITEVVSIRFICLWYSSSFLSEHDYNWLELLQFRNWIISGFGRKKSGLHQALWDQLCPGSRGVRVSVYWLVFQTPIFACTKRTKVELLWICWL